MLIIDDNKTCPECGAYGDGWFCANGHTLRKPSERSSSMPNKDWLWMPILAFLIILLYVAFLEFVGHVQFGCNQPGCLY